MPNATAATTEQPGQTDTLGGRLKLAFELCSLRPPALSKMTGIPVATINALTRRRSERSASTEQLLEALPADKVNHDWIRTGRGSPEPQAVSEYKEASVVIGPSLAPYRGMSAAYEAITSVQRTRSMTMRHSVPLVTPPAHEQAAPSDGLSVAFRANTASTIGREEFDELAAAFAQDAAFVIHLALARLRDAVNAGEAISVKLGPAATQTS